MIQKSEKCMEWMNKDAAGYLYGNGYYEQGTWYIS